MQSTMILASAASFLLRSLASGQECGIQRSTPAHSIAQHLLAAARESSRCAGEVVVDVGDVDGDGCPDWAIGKPRALAEGKCGGCVLVISGADGTTLREFWGDSTGDRFGWSVSGAGDVNRDGYPDILVGAPLDDVRGNASGSAYLFSGHDGMVLLVLHGVAAGDQFGYSVADVGDVNADGTSDLAIGAPLADRGGDRSGTVDVCSGIDGAILAVFDGSYSGAQVGRTLASSGAPDVAVGAAGGFDLLALRARLIDTDRTTASFALGSSQGSMVLTECSSGPAPTESGELMPGH